MQNEDLQKILDELNDNAELKQKYMQAATAEEKRELLAGVTGISQGGLQELSDDELDAASGGSQQYLRCRAVCTTCGWRSRIGSPDFAYDLGVEHTDSSIRCSLFTIVAI